MKPSPPVFDSEGLHILDPHDTLGIKSEYITLIQEQALRAYLPEGQNSGLAVDLGCGYGRLTEILAQKGWKAIGIDPDENSLSYARQHHPAIEFRQGGLPDLPVPESSVQLLLIQNVLRVLHLSHKLDYMRGISRFLAPASKVVVVDNIRDGHPDYIPEETLIGLFAAEGFRLVNRTPFRAGRFWLIYPIRYGFIPKRWLSGIAEHELKTRRHSIRRPKWQYLNVLFIFERSQPEL